MKHTLVLLLFIGTAAHAAPWQRLLVRGRTIAVAHDDALAVSHDGGRRFRRLELPGITALAAWPGRLYVAQGDVLSQIGSGVARQVPLPDHRSIIDLRAGPGWVMRIVSVPHGLGYTLNATEQSVGVDIRQGGAWRPLLDGFTSTAPNALSSVLIDPVGNAIASLSFSAGCGGVSIAGGAIWRADGRPARLLPSDSSFWELPRGLHRDWIVANCEGDGCLYPPDRKAIPLPTLTDITAVHLSPDAHWIAVTSANRVHIFERVKRQLIPLTQSNGQVVVARRDGVTVRTADDRLMRHGVQTTYLGPLPPQTQAVQSDARGRLFALTTTELLHRTPAGWIPLPIPDP